MAIYHYDGTQKSPKNYIGYRVAVSVDGKLRQKWFKGKEVLPSEAKELDKMWRFEQELHKDSRNRERKERVSNSAFVTGVAGIKMKFASNGRRVVSDKLKRYYFPAFIVSGSVNNQRFIKTFNIKTFGYDMAWFKACHFAADKYGSNILDQMLRKKPHVEQFHVIHRWQTHCGCDISTTCFPNEILENGSTLEDLIN